MKATLTCLIGGTVRPITDFPFAAGGDENCSSLSSNSSLLILGMIGEKPRNALLSAERVMKLIEGLEDNDDVQNVYSNADIDESSIN